MSAIMLGNYKCRTTFWIHFRLADYYGMESIVRTYTRTKEEFKDNVVYMTDLVMVLKWKQKEHHEAGYEGFAELYNKLWTEANEFCLNHFSGEDLKYFSEIAG